MDIQYYQQEFAHFTNWLVNSNKHTMPDQMQEIMWQAWLARATTEQRAKQPPTPRNREKGRMICQQILNRLHSERFQGMLGEQ